MVETPPRQSAASFALWPIACAICLIVAVAALAGIHPEPTILRPKAVKALFFVLGFAFPALAYGLGHDRIPERARVAVAAAGALLALVYIVHVRQWGVVPFVGIEVAVAWPLLRSAWHESGGRAWAVAAMLLATFGGWSLAATLAYGMSVADLVAGRTPYAAAPAITIAFIVATILGTVTFTWNSTERASRLVYVVDLLAVALFALASWRRDVSFTGDNHHVSFFIGPVQAVEQGHWLLWDVPSQYGFANLWLIGHLPAVNAYAAFTDANAVLIFIGALVVYATARTWARTIWAAVFCAATVIAANFFVGGLWWARLGSEHYPSVGAMRFIWSYALVALMTVCYARGYYRSAPGRVLVAGSVCWLAACWWSAESAIFASVMWVPSAFALMWLRKMPLRRMSVNAALALAALIASLVLVQIAYALRPGHGPDWLSFFEFGLLYQGGAETSPLTTFGGAWLLVSVFAVLVTLALYCWQARILDALPLLVAAAAAQWATMSYFVVRSDDNNVNNLIPIQLLVLFAAMAVLARERIPPGLGTAVRLYIVPIAAVTCGMVWYVWPFVPLAGYFVADPGNWNAVAAPIPVAEQRLLQRHGLGPASPVLYLGPNINVLMPPRWPGAPVLPKAWTPGLPSLLIGQLPLAREIVYVTRFSAGEPAGGFVVTDASGPPLIWTSTFDAALGAVYTSTVVDHEGPYVLTRDVRTVRR